MTAPLLDEDASEVECCRSRLAEDLQSPIAAALIAAFYAPNGNYAGHSFLGHPPVAENNVMTESDLLAVTMLEVRFRPRASRRLLDDQSKGHARMIETLMATPWSIDVGVASDADLEAAYALRRAVYTVTGRRQQVAVQKLCARKRPHLIPIVDRVIKGWLALETGGYWKTIRALLADADVSKRLRELAACAEDRGVDGVTLVPDLRLFDSLVWMLHSEGAKPTRDKLQA